MPRPRKSRAKGSGAADKTTATAERFELLTSAEAAKYLGVSNRTLADWRQHNVGPSYRRLGIGRRSHVRYARADLDDFMLENYRPTPSRFTSTLQPSQAKRRRKYLKAGTRGLSLQGASTAVRGGQT